MAGRKKPAKASKKKPKPNFFVWLRSGLRSLSRKHQPIYEALADAKRPYKGSNARQKFVYCCALCGGDFPAKEVSVDHREECGSLLGWDDIQGFMERLFCEKQGLDVLCDSCHSCKTYSSRYDVTMEEARYCLDVIAFMKQPKEEVVAFLAENGYNGSAVSNEAKRKALVSVLLKEKLNE